MKRKLYLHRFVVAIAAALISSVDAQTPRYPAEIVKVTLDEHGNATVNGVAVSHYPNLKGLFLGMPQPHYPPELRLRRITGSGIFTLYIDESGKVADVKIRKSTGHRELDIQSIDALRQYRTKSGPKREIDIPITYRLPERQTYF